jgi:hypothetical protein
MSAQIAQTTVQTAVSTQTATQTRERQSLSAYTNPLEEGMALTLKGVRFLPANGELKAAFGGILDGFVDELTGETPSFVGKNGDVISGGLPVRLYGAEAELAHSALGLEVGQRLLLGVKPDVSAAIYRGADGSVAYAVLPITALTGKARWEAPIVFELI